MSHELGKAAESDRPRYYQIRVAGRLDPQWEGWFDGLTITLDDGDTLITGRVTDQAALHGLLRRVRDLGLELVSVTQTARPVDAAGPDQLPRHRRGAAR